MKMSFMEIKFIYKYILSKNNFIDYWRKLSSDEKKIRNVDGVSIFFSSLNNNIILMAVEIQFLIY